MVVVTRAAAARQRQRTPAVISNMSGAINKKCRKKKKRKIDQCLLLSVTSSTSQSLTETSSTFVSPTSDAIESLSIIRSNTSASSVLPSTTPPTSELTASPTQSSAIDDLSNYQNDNDPDGIGDACQDIDLSSVESSRINDEPNSKQYDGDVNNQLDTCNTWPIVAEEIQWCKTNRGNDRVCMGGFTYDFTSQTLKRNIRNFRCSKKARGCRSIIHIFIDSSTFKGSNGVEHNHPPHHHEVKRLLVMQKVKERVTMEPTSVMRIIEDEYAKYNLNNDDRQHFLLPSAQGI